MLKTIVSTLIVLWMGINPCFATVLVKHKSTGGGGGSNVTIFDDFADSPTSRWTSLYGTPSWSANTYSLNAGVYARNNTQLNTTSNYVKVKILTAGDFSILLRNSGTGGAYSVSLQGTSVGVNEILPGGSNDGWVYDGPSGTLAFANNDTVAVTITGTGTSTVIRVWKNTVNNTPVSVSGWDSSGDTADLTINLTSYTGTFFDTGKYVGLGYWSATSYDDFYAGDI